MQAHWTRGQTIGRGSFATVSTAMCRGSSQVFAVKSAELSNSESLQREQMILSSLSCQHVVSYKGFDITKENNKDMHYNLHLEYVPGGSLFDEIRETNGKLDEAKMGYYTREILQGLQFLHSNGVVHCDIKSKNILVGENVVKIADFGCAKRVGYVEDEAVMGGTPMFMAPEVARGEEQRYPCDIWALGCTIIEMATASLPWQDVSDVVSTLYKIAYSVELPEIPGFLSEDAKDFLEKCLRRNPRERWTAAQLLEHPFVSGVNCTIKQARTCSPTSILDQGFWSSVEELESQGNSVPGRPFDCQDDRIRMLSEFSEEPRWELDESWITIRGNVSVEDLEVDFSDFLNFQDSNARCRL